MEDTDLPLNLSQPSATQTVFNGGISIDNLTWWFWVKAGMGFTLGAGAVYVAFAVVWFLIVSRLPELVILRAITRF